MEWMPPKERGKICRVPMFHKSAGKREGDQRFWYNAYWKNDPAELVSARPARAACWRGWELADIRARLRERRQAARGGGSYVLLKVRCGNSTCRYSRAGWELHGPYWYLYWKKDRETRGRYVGKEKPAEG